ncbi:uncharacterized protein LOC123298072 [Chrysoperla carnea]|uniref:uncharacterized protein LOC123298072 n=1 Tax=Chrysoperla carnea TaxID=189513 RepID=UPI001D07EBFA|nr:uncharacterized protein LOC123298072 [Chrysoperla carnea]
MSKSAASFGVNQIIQTEKNAAQKIEEARQRRVLRLKQAEKEAKEEVQKLRLEREEQFNKFKEQAISLNKDAELRVEKAAKAAMDDLEHKANRNRSKVIEDILQLICDVKPEIHQNYLIHKDKTRKIIRPDDAFEGNIQTIYSSQKVSQNITDQYEVRKEKENEKVKPRVPRESFTVTTDLCNLCSPETRIEDGRVCAACNPNATFSDPKELAEWKCPGILCDGGGADIDSEQQEYTPINRAETIYQRTPFTDVKSLISEENEYSISEGKDTVEHEGSGNITDEYTKSESFVKWGTVDEYTKENENYRSDTVSTAEEYHELSHSQRVKSSSISSSGYPESSDDQIESHNISSSENHESIHDQVLSHDINFIMEENHFSESSHNQVNNTAEYHESSHGDKQHVKGVPELEVEKKSKDENVIENENHLFTTLDLSENPSERTTIVIEIPRIGDNFHPTLPWKQTHCRKCSRNTGTRNITINLNSMKIGEEPNSTKDSKLKEEPLLQTEDDIVTVNSGELNIPRGCDIKTPTATISTSSFNVSTNDDNDSLHEPEF